MTTPDRIRDLLAAQPAHDPPTHDELEAVAVALGRYPTRAEWEAAGVRHVPNLYASDGMRRAVVMRAPGSRPGPKPCP
jgi:hypothetical protein